MSVEVLNHKVHEVSEAQKQDRRVHVLLHEYFHQVLLNDDALLPVASTALADFFCSYQLYCSWP